MDINRCEYTDGHIQVRIYIQVAIYRWEYIQGAYTGGYNYTGAYKQVRIYRLAYTRAGGYIQVGTILHRLSVIFFL